MEVSVNINKSFRDSPDLGMFSLRPAVATLNIDSSDIQNDLIIGGTLGLLGKLHQVLC